LIGKETHHAHAKKSGFTNQTMPLLSASIRLAQEMGESMGRSEILFGTLPQQQ